LRKLVFSQSRNILNFIEPECSVRIHKCTQRLPILSQLDPFHTPTSHFLKIKYHVRLSLFESYQNISPGPRPCLWVFRKKIRFNPEELLAPRPTPQAGGPPLVSCPRLLIQYIRSCSPYWRPFLHAQPENAPCRGDMVPLITRVIKTTNECKWGPTKLRSSYYTHRHFNFLVNFGLMMGF